MEYYAVFMIVVGIFLMVEVAIEND